MYSKFILTNWALLGYKLKWVGEPPVMDLYFELLKCSISACRFSDKTQNNWEDRGKFVKHAGKYDLIAVDYEATVRNNVT